MIITKNHSILMSFQYFSFLFFQALTFRVGSQNDKEMTQREHKEHESSL